MPISAPKPGLGDDIALGTDQFEGDAVGNDGRLSVGNIGKRTGMDQSRSALQGLHQVGLDGILHQDSQRTSHTQVFSSDSTAFAVGTDDHPSEAFAHVAQIGGEGQDRHDLACHGDVEPGPAGFPFFFRAKADFDFPQEAVVGIDRPAPGDGIRIDIQAGKAAALLRGQLIRVIFLMPNFFRRRSMEGENLR